MRSTTSSSELRTIIRDDFRKYWTVPAMVMAWYLFWGCLPMLLTWEPDFAQSELQDLALNENMGYVVGMVILGMGTGMTLFSYLQNPGAANYMHSLPLSRDRLLTNKLISGLLMLTGPVAVNGVLMMALSVCFAGVTPLLFLKWMVVTWICSFAIFALTVLAAMLSGNTLMHLFNAAFLCGFVSVFLLVIYVVCGTLLIGYTPSDYWEPLLMNSNPMLAAIGHGTARWLICVLYLAAGAIALVLSRLLYQRRRIERTGESVMFPWVRTGLFLYCIFCGSILIGIAFADILKEEPQLRFSCTMAIGGAVGALLIYVIGSLMIDRSSRIFTRRNLTPAVAALVLAFAVTVGVSDDVLGYGSKVPDTAEVETVYLNAGDDLLFDAYDDDIMGYSSRFNAEYYDVSREDTTVVNGMSIIGMHSTEAIDAARGLQQALIDQNPTGSDSSMGSVTLIYALKNGHRMQRQYIVYWHANGDYFPGVAEAAAAFYESREFHQVYSLDHLKPEIFGSGTVTIHKEAVDPEDAEDDTILSYAIPRKYVPGLRDALEADFQECSYQDSRGSNTSVSILLPGSSWDDIAFPVYADAPHMKKWMKKHEALLK